MPRRVSKISTKDFEPRRKNSIFLGSDSNVDNDLKALTIGNFATNLEFSIYETSVTGTLQTNKIVCTEKIELGRISNVNDYGDIDIEYYDKPAFSFNGSTGYSIYKIGSIADSNDYAEFKAGYSGELYIETFEGADDTGNQAKIVMKTHRTISFTANKNASDYSEAYNNFIFANGVGTHGTIDLNTANNFGLYSATNYNLELKSQGTGDITLNADGGNITLKDDTTTISDFQTTQIKNEVPLLIKEAADAVADTAAYGQLWVKTATPNQLYFTTDAGDDIQLTSGTAAAFVGDITGVTAGTNCSGGGSSGDVTINVDDAFIVNDADDTMAGTLTVDKDVSNTSAGSYFGLDIDYQKTGNSTSDNTLMGLKIDAGNTTATNGTNTMYGIWNRVRLQHDADAGTATTVGSLTSVVASTNGTATAIGTDIVVTGADTNIGLRINNPDGGNDFQILSSANNNDYFQIATTAEGATTLSTVDADTAVGHLTLAPDGDLILDPVSTKVIINATDDLYFDGGGDTYITEHGVGDRLLFFVGGDSMFQLYENGDDGNEVSFPNACAGWNRQEATFSTTGIIASGGTDDTDIDFRFGNKYRLEMTGDITTINLIFPGVSGNFLLVCTTNGDHDVTNWKVWEDDESAATETDVLWSGGGSVPAFTSSGIDIVSFYWDANEQECYGVASLDFGT